MRKGFDEKITEARKFLRSMYRFIQVENVQKCMNISEKFQNRITAPNKRLILEPQTFGRTFSQMTGTDENCTMQISTK